MTKRTSAAERRAAAKRACELLQTELYRPAVKKAIEKALSDFDAANAPAPKAPTAGERAVAERLSRRLAGRLK